MQNYDVTVDGNGGHRERRDVDKSGQSEVSKCTCGLAERPVCCNMPCYVIWDVDDSDEDVADCKVGDEHVGDSVQTTMTMNDVTDERVSEQRDTEDDEVGSAQQQQLGT